MKYFATVARFGVLDLQGETLGTGVEIPSEKIPVTWNFSSTDVLGSAELSRTVDGVDAIIELNDEDFFKRIDPTVLKASVGGIVISRTKTGIARWKPTQLGLTQFPADPDLPYLQLYVSKVPKEFTNVETKECIFSRWDSSRDISAEDFTDSELDGSDYERGAIEAVEAGNENLRRSYARLMQHLMDTEVLTDHDVYRIVKGHKYSSEE